VKIYTRSGDQGETSLFSGGRVRKDDARVEAYGTVDELCSLIGLLKCEALPEGVLEHLTIIQEALFAAGSMLADPRGRVEHKAESWSASKLEDWIDEMDEELEPLTAFILPGGSRSAALAHVVRAVCRRAERRICALDNVDFGAPEELQVFFNRLSDAFFVLARFLNARSGISECQWHPTDR
jgi:cob(I)alamin adenosyltransferase